MDKHIYIYIYAQTYVPMKLKEKLFTCNGQVVNTCPKLNMYI